MVHSISGDGFNVFLNNIANIAHLYQVLGHPLFDEKNWKTQVKS